MSKLDDLQTLKRLLKDFKFPVSPILEYAIKEKEAELCAECHSVNKEVSKFEQTERAVDNEQISFASLKDEFYNYLYSTKSEFAARNYIRCLDKPIRTFIKAIDSEADSIYSYKTVAEVRSVLLKLKADDSFVAVNKKRYNSLSAAISNYLKFLESKENRM